MNRQQALFTDLPRATELQLLRKLKLETYRHKSGSVSGAVMKSLLRAIDDHDGGRGCYASQQTLADEVGCSVKTIARAVAGLLANDLIVTVRENHWSPTCYRVVFNSVAQIVRKSTCGHSDRSSGHPVQYDPSPCPDREDIVSATLSHDDAQNANETHLNATTNRPAEWEAVAVEMFDWGLKTAGQSVDAACQRGWSIEYVLELWSECGRDREPERWEPGQLANLLTGKTPPPFDEAEAMRRREDRKQAAADHGRDEAERIRERVTAAGRSRQVAPEVIQGTIGRRLRESGLESFATSAENAAAEQLDRFDEARAENRLPHVDARERTTLTATPEPHKSGNALGVHFRPRRVPPANRGTVACDRRRADLFRALGVVGMGGGDTITAGATRH